MTKTLKKRKIYNVGGKVLASGGYGCVFTPALKCKNAKYRDKNKISKLMTEKHAVQEYQEIKKIQKKLADIPNYKEHFLVYNATICRPDKLTDNDLIAFSEKCSALPKDDITKSNINTKLDNIMSLNLPNGGLPVDDYVYTDSDYSKLYRTHQSLVQLLKKGILPMNRKNIYHSDIKDSNILVDDSSKVLITRLIDWGLAVDYRSSDSEFPHNWRNRPLQFNSPFSIIIFTDSFYDKYSNYLKNGGEVNELQLKPFVITYINEWIKERGAGHYKFINEIMYLLYNNTLTNMSNHAKTSIVETEIALPYIINYIVHVLVHYTRFHKDGTLNLREYLNQVFIKIVDIWGFITVYYPILEIFSNNYSLLSKNEIQIFNQIQRLFCEYLYKPRHTPIPIDDLTHDLDILGDLIKKELDNQRTSISTAKTSVLASRSKQTRKIRGSTNSSIFKRQKLVKKYKHSFLLSLK